MADVVLKAASAARLKVRYPAGGVASRLRLLRRFAPAGVVDAGIRKDLAARRADGVAALPLGLGEGVDEENDDIQSTACSKDGETISTTVVEMHEHYLMPGDVTIAVDYSTVNDKDALAFTRRADVMRQSPVIPGIDFAGTVEASSYPGIAVGDRVVANSQLSQPITADTRRRRAQGEWLINDAGGLSRQRTPWQSARLGTRRCCLCWRSNMAASHRSVVTSSSPAPMAASAPSRSRSCRISAIASSRQPDVSMRAITCAASARRRSSSAGRFRARSADRA